MKVPILAIATVVSSAQLGKAWFSVVTLQFGDCFSSITQGVLTSTVPVTTVTYHDPDATINSGCGRKRSHESTRYGYPPSLPTATTPPTTPPTPTPTPTTIPQDSLGTIDYVGYCTTTVTQIFPSETLYVTDPAWTSTVTQYATTHLVFCGITLY